jgi:hypothetical protein
MLARLSWNHIFLGIATSFRAMRLLHTLSQMRNALDPELLRADVALMSMFGRHLTVHDLEIRVDAIGGHSRQNRPVRKTRACFLEWLHAN